ncbi:hypothetical protein [Aurantivibrio plasticivorans]
MTDFKKAIPILTPGNLDNDEQQLLELDYEMFPDQDVKLFIKGQHLIVWTSYYSKMKKIRRSTQEEYPLEALPWFIDTIENDFWNYNSDPAVQPGDVSENTIVDGEKIGINPMKHCCAENLFGYSLWNASRKDHVTGLPPQDWQIPKYMLEDGLLDELKTISTKLGLKSY